jgi:hypothetical protein
MPCTPFCLPLQPLEVHPPVTHLQYLSKILMETACPQEKPAELHVPCLLTQFAAKMLVDTLSLLTDNSA